MNSSVDVEVSVGSADEVQTVSVFLKRRTPAAELIVAKHAVLKFPTSGNRKIFLLCQPALRVPDFEVAFQKVGAHLEDQPFVRVQFRQLSLNAIEFVEYFGHSLIQDNGEQAGRTAQSASFRFGRG